MGFSLKNQVSKDRSEGFGEKIDYAAINAQVPDDVHAARVSQIILLGKQLGEESLGSKGTTKFETEDEAQQFITEVTEKFGEKNDAVKKIGYELVDGEWVVNANLYTRKAYPEVAIVVDLVDTIVDYGDKIGKKQFRILLNPTFNKKLKGFPLKPAVPAKEGDPWTFDSKSILAKLARATGKDEILKDGDSNMDIGLILGMPLNITTEIKDGFLKVVNISKMSNKEISLGVTELDQPAIGIDFDSVTVDMLEKANIRKNLLEKIKQATDYAGSNMQTALEAYEATKGKNTGDKPANKPKAAEDESWDSGE